MSSQSRTTPISRHNFALRALLMCVAVLTLPLVTAPVYAQNDGICARTPEVRRAILRELPTNDCAAVTAADLAGITGALGLSGMSVTTLKADDFAGLTGLTKLELQHNYSLTELPEGIFDSLVSLTELSVHFNPYLASLPDGVFDGLTGLTELRLSGNYYLASLPDGVFNGLTNLTNLDLSGNHFLASLPDEVFGGLTSLTELDLSGSPRLTSLPDGVFKDLTNLTKLDLSGNTYSDSLRGKVFNGLTNLTELDLSLNHLTSLPDGVFDRLVSLTSLNLLGNVLDSLPSIALNLAGNLTELNLSHNKLDSLPNDMFTGLTNLAALNLSGNYLTSLPDAAFNPLINLTSLNLADNELASLPGAAFTPLVNLASLDLSGNYLTSLSDTVFEPLVNLTSLDLRSNKLASLPDGVFVRAAGAENLRYLYLYDNIASDLLPMQLVRTDDISDAFGPAAVVVSVPTGAPAALTVTLSVEGGTFSVAGNAPGVHTYTATIANSATMSAPVTVTRDANSEAPATLKVIASTPHFIRKSLYFSPSSAIPAAAPLKVFPHMRDSCDRTPQVAGKIVAALRSQRKLQSNQGCKHVAAGNLAAITSLDLSNSGIASLKVGDFTGLTGLTALNLQGNALTALPTGAFVRASNSVGLQSLDLRNNSSASFTLPMQLVRTNGDADLADPATMVVRFPTSAPSDIFVVLQAAGGNISADGLSGVRTYTTTVATGADTSGPFVVVRDPGSMTEVTLTATASWADSVNYYGIDLPSAKIVQALPQLEGICGRTRQVRDAIMRRLQASNCANVDATILANVTYNLWLNGRNITTLKVGDFAGLSNLNSLHLNNNQLRSLPDGVFVGLDNLTSLYLESNLLSSLADNAFDGLGKLTWLSMTDNRLKSLPNDLFNGLSDLKVLHLNHTRLTSLSDDVFDGLNQLTILNFGYNRLTVWPGAALGGLSNLTWLRFANNGLTSLPGNALDGLRNLYSLDLSNNQLTTLPANVFVSDGDVEELSDLRLQGNPGADFTLPLQFVRTDADTDAPGPATIALHFPAGAPATLSVTLSAQGGTLSADSNVPGASVYTAVIATGATVSESFTVTRGANAEAQTVLEVTDTALPTHGQYGSYTYTARYTGFTIPNNATIKLFPRGVCDRTLQVRDAIVQALRDGDVLQPGEACANVRFAHLQEIETLDISGSGIASLRTGDFAGLENLAKLNLSGNELANLPANVFAALTEHAELDLGGNLLTEFPGGAFGNLSGLNLYGNQISELPADAFTGLGNLNSLKLGKNKIAELPPGVFSPLAELTALGLDENGLTALPEDIFRALSKLNLLHLQGNALSELPAGVFVRDEAAELLDFNASNNPGAPFYLPMQVVRVDADAAAPGPAVMAVSLPAGAPAALAVTLSAAGGEFSGGDAFGVNTYTVTIAAGATVSSAAALTRYENTAPPASVRVAAAPRFVNPSIHYDDISFFDANNPPAISVFPNLTDICARTLQVRRAILSGLPQSSCADVGIAQLAQIANLSLYSGGIRELRADDFAGLFSLTTLNMAGNRALAELPAGVFNDLHALQNLFLDNNGLTGLPGGVFDQLTKLETLGLKGNKLTELPPRVLDSLVNLTTLNASNNRFTTLPPGVFGKLSALTSLDLSLHRLTELPPAIFVRGDGRAAEMHTVKMRKRRKSEIFSLPLSLVRLDADADAPSPAEVAVRFPAGAPVALKVTLSAQGGALSAGSVTIPAGATVSESVTLTRSAYVTTPVTLSMKASPPPEMLGEDETAYNGFAIADTATLTLFPSLANICGRSEKVRDAIVAALRASKDLRRNKNCRHVDREKLGNVEALTLASQNLGAVKASDFFGLIKMETLNLSANALTTLPTGVFSGLQSLHTLHLNDNALTALPAGVFAGLRALHTLHLNDNALSALPRGVFVRAPQPNNPVAALRVLNLGDNPTAEFPLPLQIMRTDASDESEGPATIEVRLPHGAPAPLAVTLVAQGGKLSSTYAGVTGSGTANYTAAIATGETAFKVTLTRNADTTSPVNLRIEGATLPAQLNSASTAYAGLTFTKGAPVTIFAAAGLPRNVAVGGADRQLTLMWKSALRDTADITGYTVRWKLASADKFVSGDSAVTAAAATLHTITGLTNGVAYDVEVAARTASATGDFVKVQGVPAKFTLHVLTADFELLHDIKAIARYILGVRDHHVVSTRYKRDAAVIQARIAAGVESGVLDVTGDGVTGNADAEAFLDYAEWRDNPAVLATEIPAAVIARIEALLP